MKHLSFYHNTPIYCLVNGSYINFYSVLQAYLYMRTSSKRVRKELLATIETAKHLEIAKTNFKIKTGWATGNKHKKILMEILIARYSQNTLEGKALLKTKKSELKKLKLKGFEEIDDRLYLKAILFCRKKVKERKGKLKMIPFYSADLED